jgi:putative nucleotidyltransferase with HDIG domain
MNSESRSSNPAANAGRAVAHHARRLLARAARVVPAPILVLAYASAGIALFFPYSSTTHAFDLPKEGEIANETIIAPFTYDVVKLPEDLARERLEAGERVPLVLDWDQETVKKVRRSLVSIKSALAAVPPVSDSIPGFPGLHLSAGALTTLRRSPHLVAAACDRALAALDKGILAVPVVKSEQQRDQLAARYNTPFLKFVAYDKDLVSLRRNSSEIATALADLPVKEQALESIAAKLREDPSFAPAGLDAAYELLNAVLVPNVNVNEGETARRRQKAESDVLAVRGKVIKETEIVGRHQVVTADIVDRLYSLHKTEEQMDHRGVTFRARASNAGELLLVIIVLCFLAAYMRRYEWREVGSVRHAVAIATIVVFQAAIIRLALLVAPRVFESAGDAGPLVLEYVVPTSVGAMLAAILFDIRTSFIVALFTAVLFGVSQGFNLQFALLALLTGLAAGYFARTFRYRWDFIKAVPWVSLVYAVLILVAQGLLSEFSPSAYLQDLALAFVNCIASVFLVMMSAMLFESVFDIATDMTLIELSDMNNPVLKRLSIEAAGTYNHSVLVGNLAESAAEKIGANPLRARVASYYHDIGKIEKADYFIENASANDRSRHTRLAPSMSALIISAHVKEGVELARRHKLPRVIRDAIMQHHGTSTVSYFFEKARQLDPHNQVREDDFRYPGPLPQTRENAVIMLADAVEAASRSLATSSPKLLRELVRKIIRDKFASGQLDQCDLTLRDLDRIVEGFMPILQGIFHTRDPNPHKENNRER